MDFGQSLFKNPLDPFSRECNVNSPSDVIKHFHTPVTTSTSVLGLAYENGVIMAADVLGSYGSLARFKSCPRLIRVNRYSLIGVSGDYADYQYLQSLINNKIIGEECLEDDIIIKPESLHCWLTRILYNRRSKEDPLWNNILVGGLQNGVPFLGASDKLGTSFKDGVIGTGYGAYIAVPLMREAVQKSKYPLSKEAAIEVVKKCMEILYYRDARSFNKFELGIVSPEKSEVIGPLSITANWDIAYGI